MTQRDARGRFVRPPAPTLAEVRQRMIEDYSKPNIAVRDAVAYFRDIPIRVVDDLTFGERLDLSGVKVTVVDRRSWYRRWLSRLNDWLRGRG